MILVGYTGIVGLCVSAALVACMVVGWLDG